MNFKRITTFCVTIAIILSFSVATVFAAPDKNSSVPASSTPSSSTPSSSTPSSKPPSSAPPSTTPPPPSSETPASPPPETVSSTAPTQGRVVSDVSSAVSSAVPSAVSLQAVSSAISMPDVDSADISVPQLLGSGVYVNPLNDKNVLLGVIAWVCIGLGIIIVLVVLFSSKKNAHRSMGRKRYHRKSLKTHKKRLLDDKYYNRRKYK